ncbi:mechanosensitive ion channel family protein [Streptomonospora wellingtoniae]|uniref:Mechanosensitive ion channel family protein n=1 Tax=Streptomonospora wellingtoniae TaxID=3075544 RepID=A0ABU2KY17_9ACTN|nr:mechanosensitive ion channel family protein [Streptomonospora sp. DSM 45055]MDT0304137.1 mechanosensitive ion channel family protein [Streptomonospora sp. DSM 45055]
MPGTSTAGAGVPPLLGAEGNIFLMAQAGPVVDWFSDNSGAFISGAIRIVLILVIAVIVRAVAGRLIEHGVKRMASSHQRLGSGRLGNRVLAKANGSGSERQQQRAETISAVLRSAASIVIIGVAVVMALGELGVNLGPILMSAGVLGLAIGFGAQSLVQDFLSGVFMLIEDQYGVGDVVDVGEAVGTVEEVGLRVTKIRDLSGGLWYVRNGEILRVCNMNQDWACAVVEIPLDSRVDVAQATEVVERSLEAFAERPEQAARLLEAPSAAGVVGIANGAVVFRVMAKTKPGEQWELDRDLRGHLKREFDRAGIRLAHPMQSSPAGTA